MLKRNKLRILISSVVILLPIIFGIIMWNDLPEVMSVHFGADGSADGFGGKGFVVFGLPCILLGVHFICLLFTLLDKKQREQSPKALNMIFWIVPAISLFVSTVMYSVAFGLEFNLEMLIPISLGVFFIIFGNYMPKIKQNSTLGIKITWTLRNEENWNKTHRFGGKVMVVCGFVMLLSAFLPIMASVVILICAILLDVIFPILYSYRIYRQHKKQGIEYAPRARDKHERLFAVIGILVASAVLIGVMIVMFTGNIEVSCEESSFKINATYWTDLEVNYSELDSVEYRSDFDVGLKANGFNSARLLMGVFKNEEFGSYTVYAYADAKEFVVLGSNGKTLVIGMSDAKETQAIYNTILEKTGGK